MRERSLVAFTIFSQTAVGGFWALGALHIWATRQVGSAIAHALTDTAWLAVAPLMALAMLASFFHLGKPLNVRWVFANLRSSWLSREVLFVALFAVSSGLFAWLQWFKWGSPAVHDALGLAAGLLGLAMAAAAAKVGETRCVNNLTILLRIVRRTAGLQRTFRLKKFHFCS